MIASPRSRAHSSPRSTSRRPAPAPRKFGVHHQAGDFRARIGFERARLGKLNPADDNRHLAITATNVA